MAIFSLFWRRMCACNVMWCTVKKLLGFVAQWIERLSPEQKVVGSIPIKPTSMAFG